MNIVYTNTKYEARLDSFSIDNNLESKYPDTSPSKEITNILDQRESEYISTSYVDWSDVKKEFGLYV